MSAAFNLILALSAPVPALASAPMVQLGAIAPGPWFLGGTLAWLLIAVVVKAAAFPFLEKGLSRKTALVCILAAILLTTLLGFAALQASRSLAFMLVLMAVVYGVSIDPSRRLVVLIKEAKLGTVNAYMLASVFPLFLFLSAMGLNYATDAYNELDFKLYWTAKLAAVLVGLGFGVALSTLWEEWALARLVIHKDPSKSNANWIQSVFRANYLSAFVVLLLFLLIEVPHRVVHKQMLPQFPAVPAVEEFVPPSAPPPSQDEAPAPPPAPGN